ncbi:hypothetical protein P4T60_17810 [Bacillus atrophaeus]|nr:hypothetical protein [Bacillus atrophaeus]MED1133367.1 hypothetical protein [Bacillus atrophaeus]
MNTDLERNKGKFLSSIKHIKRKLWVANVKVPVMIGAGFCLK